MVVLRPLDPGGAHEMWGWIRSGLLSIIEKTRPHYLPEDVYTRIRNGTAWLYVYAADGDDIGFAVLTQEHDPDGLVLFVWVLWCEPGSAVVRLPEMYAETEKLAQQCKAVRIRMQSPLRGWERQTFFNKVAAVYEREIGQL